MPMVNQTGVVRRKRAAYLNQRFLVHSVNCATCGSQNAEQAGTYRLERHGALSVRMNCTYAVPTTHIERTRAMRTGMEWRDLLQHSPMSTYPRTVLPWRIIGELVDERTPAWRFSTRPVEKTPTPP